MRKSRLSWHKQSRLVERLVAGSTTRTSAQLVSMNKTTTAYYCHRDDVGYLEGEIEVDENH